MAQPRPAPDLIDDAMAEIFLRVPPDEPADLVRASLADKRCRRILTDPAFLRRYREFHGPPPLLGFFHNHPPADVGLMPRFVAAAGASPLPPPEFDGEKWWAMSGRHGRVLVDVGDTGQGLVVWDPLTGDRHRIYLPVGLHDTLYSPTVLCAVGGCSHLNCHRGPFVVVGVGFSADGVIQVFVFSSETGAWTQPASVGSGGVNYMGAQKGTVIGDEIYFTLGWGDAILKYEVAENRLSMFDPPEVYDRGASLVQMEDGSLGLAGSKGSTIYLWSRKGTHEGAAGWVQWRVLDFEKLLPSSKLFDTADVIGFAEGVGLMFVGTFAGVYTIELKSGKLKRIGDPGVFYPIVPFTSFCTPDIIVPRDPSITDGKNDMVLLNKKIIAEILLRVPPDEPADLIRASIVHKRWRRILTDPAFLHRYRDFHRRPPLLGFFHNHPPADVGPMPRFVATTGASPLPEPDFSAEEWWFMNCHHGRVLMDTKDSGICPIEGLVVWDPITHDQHIIDQPVSLRGTLYSPTVLCAVQGCNHLNCHGDPFLVVGVGFTDRIIQVFVYSSEARTWTQPASIDSRGVNYMGAQKGTVIGNEIYFTLGWGDAILKYEVAENRLSMSDPPEVYDRGASLVQMEDGSLGLAGSKGSTIYLWSRKGTRDGVAGWVQWRVLDFEKLLPSSKLFDTAVVIGFAEGLMFVGTFAGVYTIELKSGKMKRIGEPGVFYPIVPFMSFYTPDIASCALPWHAPSRDKLTAADSKYAW